MYLYELLRMTSDILIKPQSVIHTKNKTTPNPVSNKWTMYFFFQNYRFFLNILAGIAIQVARSVRKWQNPAKDFLRASKKVERNSPQRSIKKGG